MSTKNNYFSDKDLLKKIVLGVAIIEPFIAVPQIVEIVKSKDVGSVSLLTWFFYSITTTVWLLYGIKIRDVPLIVTSVLGTICDTILIVAFLYYS